MVNNGLRLVERVIAHGHAFLPSHVVHETHAAVERGVIVFFAASLAFLGDNAAPVLPNLAVGLGSLFCLPSDASFATVLHQQLWVVQVVLLHGNVTVSSGVVAVSGCVDKISDARAVRRVVAVARAGGLQGACPTGEQLGGQLMQGSCSWSTRLGGLCKGHLGVAGLVLA